MATRKFNSGDIVQIVYSELDDIDYHHGVRDISDLGKLAVIIKYDAQPGTNQAAWNNCWEILMADGTISSHFWEERLEKI